MRAESLAIRWFTRSARLSTIPDLIVACVIGDGESETCPLEGSWKSVNFLNPVRDGAVLPILHLNGYKISGPTAQGRTSDADLKALYTGRGYKPYFVEGDDPRSCISFWLRRWMIAMPRFVEFNRKRARTDSRSSPSGR
jgi:phosphoketolase